MFLHFVFTNVFDFLLVVLILFSFQTSLFTKRPYVSLDSYYRYVQTSELWKAYLNTYVRNC